MLWLLKRVFFGPETRNWAGHFTDATFNEKVVAWSLSVVVLILGICPLLIAVQYANAAEAITNMLTVRANSPMPQAINKIPGNYMNPMRDRFRILQRKLH